MSQLNCKLPDLKVKKPNGLSSSLFFHVFSGPNAIAFAQLSSRSRNQHERAANDSWREGSCVPGVNYCLKIIEVNSDYRNQGVGSALLKEVIDFCRDERVDSLFGQARGDMRTLRKWYQVEGFDLDVVDNIQLQLV